MPDADQRRGGDDRDHHRLEREVGAVEDPERRAGVQHVGEVENRDDRHAVVQRHRGAHHRLGRLIDGDDDHRQPRTRAGAAAAAPPRSASAGDLLERVIHGPVSASASWQRSHSPADAGSLETAGTIPPAALAFHAAGALDRHARHRFAGASTSVGAGRSSTSETMNSIGSCLRVPLEQRQLRRRGRDHDLRLQRAADLLVLAQRLDLGEHPLAQREQRVPALDQRRIGERVELRGRRETAPGAPIPRARPGRYRHSSSAVNDRIGASSRVSPSAIRYIAVCADRRSRERGASV